MRKDNIIRSILFLLAEYCLRGQKAKAVRVMSEWMKTHCLAVSRDQSLLDIGLFLEACGCVPTNPTKDALLYNVEVKSSINNNDTDYTGNINTKYD